MSRWVFAFAFVTVMMTWGCDGSGLAEVTGTVKMDGKELPEGDIIFESMDGTVTPAADKIINGKYTVKVAPGMKKVRINASRPTSKPDPVMGAAAREAMIAKEYNFDTKLTADIKPGRQEGVNFEVKSIR